MSSSGVMRHGMDGDSRRGEEIGWDGCNRVGWDVIRCDAVGCVFCPHLHHLYGSMAACQQLYLSSTSHLGTCNRISLNGSVFETIAHGIRDSVGFDFHPVTGCCMHVPYDRVVTSGVPIVPPTNSTVSVICMHHHHHTLDAHIGMSCVHGMMGMLRVG